MTMHERIRAKLTNAFHPQTLEITDESDLHRGHAGWREDGETHFRVKVVSTAFSGVGRLERHRMVNDALADELRERVHALAIQAKAPEEA